MCNTTFTWAGETRTCGRSNGHAGNHRSKTALLNDSKRKRAFRQTPEGQEYYREREQQRTRSREERKHIELRWRYGITLETWNDMSKAQNHRCAICRKKTDLHTDHNHKTNKVRGLLCNNCNNGLGRFKDDPARLRAAAQYLEE